MEECITNKCYEVNEYFQLQKIKYSCLWSLWSSSAAIIKEKEVQTKYLNILKFIIIFQFCTYIVTLTISFVMENV